MKVSKPSEVEVDRSWENETIAKIEAELTIPWGPQEHTRIIQVHAPLRIVETIERLYHIAGWRVWAKVSDTHKSPEWQQISFGRPGDLPYDINPAKRPDHSFHSGVSASK